MLHFSGNVWVIHMRIAIGVITRRRPTGLTRLLASIDALHGVRGTGDGPLVTQVIIVENDQASVLQAPLPCRVPIHYALEQRVGIPCARNRVIAEALLLNPRPEWLAFVDDDETVDPHWLQAMGSLAATTSADVVTGPSIPMLPPPAPRWALDSGAYNQPRYPTGTSMPHAYTNNVWTRLSCLVDDKFRFDERLLQTGGSDTHLYRRLALHNHAIVWCDEAICREWYPMTRMTRRWALQRSYRIGATNAWIMKELGEGGRLQCTWQGVRFIARGMLRTAQAVLNGKFSAASMTLPLDSARAAGLILGAFGIAQHQEYQVLHGQ